MPNGSNNRVLEVRLENGRVTVTGNNKFNRGNNQVIRWERRPRQASWQFYHIAFGMPFIDTNQPAPDQYPIRNVNLTGNQITAVNNNQGGAQRCLDYTLFIKTETGAIRQSPEFSTTIPGSNNCQTSIIEDLPEQIENEPNGDIGGTEGEGKKSY